jgi:hypothetical protein
VFLKLPKYHHINSSFQHSNAVVVVVGCSSCVPEVTQVQVQALSSQHSNAVGSVGCVPEVTQVQDPLSKALVSQHSNAVVGSVVCS